MKREAVKTFKQHVLRIPLALFALLVLVGTAAYGQTTSIVGTVSDPTGAVVPSAKITITNMDNGFVRSTTSNSAGSYKAPELPAGRYRVRTEAPGFKAYERTGITLNLNDTVRVDADLQVGEVGQSVTVEANALTVQADTNEISQTITPTQISELATNGRNILQLTALLPGAASQMPDFDSPMAQFQNRSVSFNGQRSEHNSWLIDGGEAYDRGGGGILIVAPSQDAISEFKVMTSNYGADLGQASGGMISMGIKSGTTRFHGGAWEYNRNDAMNAYNAIAKYNKSTKAKLRYNTFGFNAGGPVEFKSAKPKTFFFYNMEWRRDIIGGQIFPNAVPGQYWTGNFTGYSKTINAPSTTDPIMIAKLAADGLTPGQAFPNNTIPSNLLDPNVAALLAAGIFVKPNSVDGTHYSAAAPTTTFYREEAARVDHQFNEKFALMGHFIWDSGTQSNPTPLWSGDSYPTVGSAMIVPSWQGVVHATMNLRPNLLNEAVFNLNGNNIDVALSGVYKLPSGYTVPQYFGANPNKKIPTIGVGGAWGINYDMASWPWSNTWRSYTWKDDLSWTKGTHNLKFGAQYLYTHKNQQIFGNVQGNYQFSGQYSGDSFSDFLLGYASSYNELALQDFVHISNNNYSFYGMDDWRVTRRLTLNLGLRWEGLPHAYDSTNRLSNFYPGLYQATQKPTFLANGSMDPNGPGFTTVSGVPLSTTKFYMNGIGLAGRSGIPQGLIKNTWNTWAPRVGFAYDMFGNEKTILRAGAGIFYERLGGNEEYNMGPNVPFSYSPTANNVYFSKPSVNNQTGAGASTPVFPAGFNVLETNYKNPTTYQFSLGVQQQIHGSAVMTLSYVGNTAAHQGQGRQINTVPLNDPNRLAICGGNCSYTGATVNPDPLRFYPGFSNLIAEETGGNSSYNSLQASIRTQSWKNLTFSASYTYGHAFDIVDGDLFSNMSNPFDANYDRASAGFDRRQILNFTYVYMLPIFEHSSNRAAKTLLGGWTLSGVTLMQAGNPLNIGLGYNNLGLGNAGSNRPNQSAPASNPQTWAQWFDPSVFSKPAPLAFGTARRNSVKGPGRDNWNIDLFKKFQFTERTSLEFRAESFNTWNHTQYTSVNTSFNQGSFGKVTGVADPRVFQLGAKLQF
jgi:3D (Asp-Asp-Asp) domain-containing protein